jgi:hypothetical protein
MRQQPINGNRVMWWILGAILAPFILATVGHLLQMTITNTERISALEAGMNNVTRRLDRQLLAAISRMKNVEDMFKRYTKNGAGAVEMAASEEP